MNMDEKRKKLKKEAEEVYELDDSDIPLHEPYVRERNLRK